MLQYPFKTFFDMCSLVMTTLFHLVIFFFIFLFAEFSLSATALKTVNIVFSSESPPTSYVENEKPVGIFIELFEQIFSELPQYKATYNSMPWARAQLEVKNNHMDLFLTFPSEARKEYAEFTQNTLYLWDYGNLVFSKQNRNQQKILNAESMKDLKGLFFVSQEGVEWENENVPAYIERNFSNNIASMISLLLKRNSGDFLIMSPEQAFYYANKLDCLDNLKMKKVNFITNSKVKFHIGVRKSYPQHKELLSDIEKVIAKPSFKKKKMLIINKYTTNFNRALHLGPSPNSPLAKAPSLDQGIEGLIK